METPLLGLHHVTATADDAQADLDCFTGLLALRLVKKTVNFDNHNVYHFYYGDEHGTPNTLMTTFPYGGWGVPVGPSSVSPSKRKSASARLVTDAGPASAGSPPHSPTTAMRKTRRSAS